MQLKAVVFPAPLGPMRPTISYSWTRMETSNNACRPPKRIEMESTSRTATDTLLHEAFVVAVHGEGFPAEPSGDGLYLLADAARVLDQRHHQQHHADDARDLRTPLAQDVGEPG